MTPAELADRMNRMTSEQIAEVMEGLPTEVLEFAVRFEGMSHAEEYDNFIGGDDEEDASELCRICHDWPCRCNDSMEDELDYGLYDR